MSTDNHMVKWFRGMTTAFAHELRNILGDVGVLLFFVALPLMYPVVYTLIYNKEVVRELPVAVVDNSMTADSRQLARMADATPAISIYAYCPNMADAKRLMAERKVYGIMEIPYDYSRNIGNGQTAHVTFYSDMSLLLRFRTFMATLTDLQVELMGEIDGERIASLGAESYITGDSPLPIDSECNFLGDTEQGFASFVIPGIVILILQQSMLLGIGMLRGTSRERRLRNGGIDPKQPVGVCASALVWGRALCYFFFYLAFTIYTLHFIPYIFHLPHYGKPVDYLLFIVPLLLSVAFLGQAIAPAMRERESPFILIVATSVVFLFLSGLTWPRYAMGTFWKAVGDLVPATWGVQGFVAINSNAASLYEARVPYLVLWAMTAAYMLLAIVATRRCERRAIEGKI